MAETFVMARDNFVIVARGAAHDSRATMAVPVDPEILAARAAQAARFPAFDPMAVPPAEARARMNAAAAWFNDGLPAMGGLEDRRIQGPGGLIRVRIYTPIAATARGAILYIHGGGWLAGNVDTHDRMLRLLAEQSASVLFSVDYRLSPEHPHPAALDDCSAAWDWIEKRAKRYALDPARFAFAGDSAGATLALSLAIRLRDAGRTMPAGCALLYGCFAPGLDTESARTFGTGEHGLTAERMAWYWEKYLGPARDKPPVEATPLYADLAGAAADIPRGRRGGHGGGRQPAAGGTARGGGGADGTAGVAGRSARLLADDTRRGAGARGGGGRRAGGAALDRLTARRPVPPRRPDQGFRPLAMLRCAVTVGTSPVANVFNSGTSPVAE